MLRTRVITAAVLLALLLPALLAPSPWPFALLTLVMIGCRGLGMGPHERSRCRRLDRRRRAGRARLRGRDRLRLGRRDTCAGVVVGARRLGARRCRGVARRHARLAAPADIVAARARHPRARRRLARARAVARLRARLPVVGVRARLGRRHRGVLRRPPLRPPQARAGDQPRQELGGRVERHGGGGGARGDVVSVRFAARRRGRQPVPPAQRPARLGRPAARWSCFSSR